MCILLVAIGVHESYPLVLAANRDERFDRPTAPVAFWDDYPEVLGGRDLEHGGTWLGVTRSGKVAALTNYRESPPETPKLSRGQIISDFLTGSAAPGEYLSAIGRMGSQYPGFNLLVGDFRTLRYASNRTDSVITLERGVFGLSNHLLDTPWSKIRRGKRRLFDVVSDDCDVHDIFGVLSDQTPAPASELADHFSSVETESAVSAIFVAGKSYGTRSSTVIRISSAGELELHDRVYDAQQEITHEQSFRFVINAGDTPEHPSASPE